MTAATLSSLAGAVGLALLVPAIVIVIARVVIAPTAADRVVAVDVLSFLAVGLIALIALTSGVFAAIDAAAIPALIGFVATAALARYLEERP